MSKPAAFARIAATTEGLAKIRTAKTAQRTPEGKKWTYGRIANVISTAKGYISEDTVERFFRGDRVYRDNALAIAEVFGFTLEEICGQDEPTADETTPYVDWQEVCRELLAQQQWLTSNTLTTDATRTRLTDVYVPLGLVSRRQRPRHRSEAGKPEQGSELFLGQPDRQRPEPQEILTPISHTDFFEQVLRQGNSPRSQGQRLAIIGEPGAGKTTQLQKIGSWLLEETDYVPIWISLADLKAEPVSLREYLLDVWLRNATQELEVVPQGYKEAFRDLLKSGKVWLLLDGADEMSIANPLQYIATQVGEGWMRNVRVVLTCRLNVWDGAKNALFNFDVYRNLDFEYPEQVFAFIDRWFVNDRQLAEGLKQALEDESKVRLRDTIKNPLRLLLLCYSWQLRQGELPETKAGLYKWFVDAFYDWNFKKVAIELKTAKRRELNRAFGELAKAAIDRDTSRFRLEEKFVTQHLGDADDEDSMFYLALGLGWLNCVGVAAENLFEKVYAFFHPTFQEYFAACAIEDWAFFLNHIPSNPYLGTYRVFEKNWQEVIELWIGRSDLEIEKKTSFIDALENFDDGCGNFYRPDIMYSLTSLVNPEPQEEALWPFSQLLNQLPALEDSYQNELLKLAQENLQMIKMSNDLEKISEAIESLYCDCFFDEDNFPYKKIYDDIHDENLIKKLEGLLDKFDDGSSYSWWIAKLLHDLDADNVNALSILINKIRKSIYQQETVQKFLSKSIKYVNKIYFLIEQIMEGNFSMVKSNEIREWQTLLHELPNREETQLVVQKFIEEMMEGFKNFTQRLRNPESGLELKENENNKDISNEYNKDISNEYKLDLWHIHLYLFLISLLHNQIN